MASGGDFISGRRLYCDEVSFRIQGRLFMMCNDLPPITPADAMDTMFMLRLPHQFVDELGPDSFPFMRLRDPTIREFCKQPRIIAAYDFLVREAYLSSLTVPDPVARETTLFRIEGGDEWVLMKKCFSVTGDKRDRIHSTEVARILKQHKANISSQKARQRLEMMGATFGEKVAISDRRDEVQRDRRQQRLCPQGFSGQAGQLHVGDPVWRGDRSGSSPEPSEPAALPSA
jgi:hypothetical protein